MIQNKEECILKFKKLVEKICQMNWISAADADDSKLQYEEFLTSASSEYKNHFLDYFRNNDSIDKFLKLIKRNSISFGTYVKLHSFYHMDRLQ